MNGNTATKGETYTFNPQVDSEPRKIKLTEIELWLYIHALEDALWEEMNARRILRKPKRWEYAEQIVKIRTRIGFPP